MYRALAWLLLSLSALAFAQSPEERLFEAIAQGKPLVAEGLVANGRVNLEARNAEGETPLHRAVEKGLRDLAGLFLKSGARVSARSNSGETALHLAALHADPWFAGLLLAAKADPRARNDEGESPLHWAALSGNAATAQRLLEGGADANLRDIRGNLPLHGAADGGDIETVRLLLKNTADATARNREGRSAADLARERNYAAIAKLLEVPVVVPKGDPGLRTRDIDDPEHPRFQRY